MPSSPAPAHRSSPSAPSTPNTDRETISPSTSTEISPPRHASEIISGVFPPFNRESELGDPFIQEDKRDAKVRADLQNKLLCLLLEFHAWSTIRQTVEKQRLVESLEKESTSVAEIEQEQARTRTRLREFVSSIQAALSTLVGAVF